MRALLIEDHPPFTDSVIMALNPDFKVVACADFREARKAIESDPTFDIIFLDDMLPDQTIEPVSCAEINVPTLNRILTNPVIVAYTQTFPDTRAVYEARLKRLGATAVHHKNEIVDPALRTRWIELIDTARMDKAGALKLSTDNKLGTRAALESTGIAVMSEVIQTLFDDVLSANLKLMGGGMSGDLILELETETKTNQGHWILKLSRDEGAILREFNGAPLRAESFQAVVIQKTLQKPIDGWWAGKSALVPNSTTLEKALLSTKTAKKQRELASTVWGALLEKQYCKKPHTSPPPHHPTLTARFTHSLMVACSSAEEALRTIYGKNKAADEIAGLRHVIESNEGTMWPFNGAETLRLSHGDFHPRNILIGKHGEPYIIDWGRVAFAPRATDLCALAVDLLVRGEYLTPAKRWSLTQAESDKKTFLALLSAKRKQAAKPVSNPIFGFIEALFQKQRTAGGSPLELRASLCFQALRYGRFDTLPLPRRILAFQCAVDLAS